MKKKLHQQQRGLDKVLSGQQTSVDRLEARLSQLEAYEFGVTYYHGQRVFISNSNAKTTLYTIDISDIGANGLIEVILPFIFLNNTASAHPITFTVDFGAESSQDSTSTFGTSASYRVGRFTLFLANANSESAQNLEIHVRAGAVSSENAYDVLAQEWVAFARMTQDTTTSKTLTISATLPVSNPNLTLETLSPLVHGPFRVA